MVNRNTSVDLGEIQRRLNEDVDYRAKFLADPVTTMSDGGLTLSKEMSKNLVDLVNEIKGGPKSVPGSGTGSADDGVLISIGKSF